MSKGGEQERHNSLTSFFTIRLKKALRDSLGLQGSQGTPRGEEAWITGLRATQCRKGNPPQKESLACSVALGFIFKYPRVSCDKQTITIEQRFGKLFQEGDGAQRQKHPHDTVLLCDR